MISIIIPVYNADEFLFKCLNSIRMQIFTNFEVWMIDDGSQDDSSNICKKFAQEDSRFHYVYQENQGVSHARNTGLEVAGGDYISFIDADDQVKPNYLQELFDALQSFDFVISGYKVVEDSIVTSRVIGSSPKILNRRELCSAILMNSSVYSFPWNRLYKSSIIRNHKIKFDTSIRYGEDLVFNLQYCQYINEAYVLSTDNYLYIQHESSASSESIGRVSAAHLTVRVEDVKAMVRSLELLSKDYNESIFYLTYRIMKEGSIYYRLMCKYKFPVTDRQELKITVQRYLNEYLKMKTQQKKDLRTFVKSWLNLNFPSLINLIK